MKNFNISKIKLKSKKEPTLERKLTGEVISEIKAPNVEPNAELEGEEVIQFPDGVMHTVKGNPHSKGGVKMNIPDGTRILSKVLTLSKKNVSEAKKIFDIELSTKDSFAKAQEKFEKKIGLKRLFDEQEELFKILKSELQKPNVSEGTSLLNQQYLSEKISDIEEQKNSKEDVRKQFFEFIFNSQEESKSIDKKNMPKKEDEGMKYGGIFGKFEDGGEQDLGESEYIPVMAGMEQSFIPISKYAMENEVITPVDNFCPEGHTWDSNLQMCVKTAQNLDDTNIALFEDGGMVRIDYSKVNSTAPDYGGIGKDKFSELARKYGLTEEQALNMLNVTKYQDGGQTGKTVTFVMADASGKYYLTKIGGGVNTSTAINPKDIQKGPDGSISVSVDGSKVQYPFYTSDKDGTLTRVSTSPANETDSVLSAKGYLKSTPPAKTQETENIKKGKLPEGVSLNQYRALQKEYDTPMKIAKGFAEGKISKETGNLLQYDISNPKDPIVFKTSTAAKSVYADSDLYKRKDQSANKAAWGEVKEEDIPFVMEYLYRNFPDIVTSEDVFGVKFNTDGTITYNKNLDFSKVLPQVMKFQERADTRMRSTANTIINNPELFDAESIKDAQNFLESETFVKGLKARGFDSMLGNFTSGRYNKGVDVVTPEEREALSKKGIFTVRQLQQEVEKDPTLLSDASKEKLGIISDIMVDDADFVLNPYEQMKEKPKEQPQEKKPKEGDKIVDDIKLPKKGMPMRYAVPSYYPLPPSPLQAHFAPQSKFGLIDPVRIGIEQQIQTSGESMKFSADQLQDLPPQQRAAVIAQMQADRQKQLNEVAYQANVVNAQNLSQTELFNLNQRDKQSEADIRNKLNFEQRQYMAMANTEEDLRRYFDRLNDIDMNQFMVNQNLNLLNELSDDYNLSSNMMQAEYAPSYNYQVRGGNPYSELFGNPYV